MGRLFFLLAISLALLGGYGLGSGYIKKDPLIVSSAAVEPIKEFKPFTIVFITQNNGPWIKRALRSIFEQEYDNFRLVIVDDGSRDDTVETVNEFVLANRQEHRVVLIRNEVSIGFEAALSRASTQCLDGELVIPMRGCDWLASPTVLSRLNGAFQKQTNWVVSSSAIQYPSYRFHQEGLYCFYGALFKRMDQSKQYPNCLLSLAQNKTKNLPDRMIFSNETL